LNQFELDLTRLNQFELGSEALEGVTLKLAALVGDDCLRAIEPGNPVGEECFADRLSRDVLDGESLAPTRETGLNRFELYLNWI
jgi:hypothetical protein